MAQDKIAPQGEGNGFQMNYAKGLIFMLISATGIQQPCIISASLRVHLLHRHPRLNDLKHMIRGL